MILLKVFAWGLALFSLSGILYQLYITDCFFFERNGLRLQKARKRILNIKNRMELIRVGQIRPESGDIISIDIPFVGTYCIKETDIPTMGEYHFDWMIIKLLYSHESTERMADSYKWQVNARILDRGYYIKPSSVKLNERDSSSPLSDKILRVYTENQKVMSPIDSVGEEIEEILKGEKAPGKWIEFEPRITTKPKRVRIRH